MIQKTRKKALFLAGIIFASVLGLFGNYVRANYSKLSSLLLSSSIETAYADTVDPNTGAAYYNSVMDGGCSGGDSDGGGGGGGGSGV